jgi:hypothetical protein
MYVCVHMCCVRVDTYIHTYTHTCTYIAHIHICMCMAHIRSVYLLMSSLRKPHLSLPSSKEQKRFMLASTRVSVRSRTNTEVSRVRCAHRDSARSFRRCYGPTRGKGFVSKPMLHNRARSVRRHLELLETPALFRYFECFAAILRRKFLRHARLRWTLLSGDRYIGTRHAEQ